MKAKPYSRENDGERFAFHGMNTVLPPDKLPPGKYPYAQNVRAYVREGVTSRATQDSSVLTLPTGVHTLRRLNDTTPAGPAGGFILVSGAGSSLYANAVAVDTGFSGNPLSLLPFRPNASVQPWMYVGDSVKMDKVRSDGTTYKMGIQEPQVAPVVTSVPASNTVSLIGPVTVYYFNNVPHNAGSVYVWRNANDPFSGAVVQGTGQANGVTLGNSLLFDNGLNVNGSVPVQWTTYNTFVGSVDTNGTAVTWVSGAQFGGLSAGNSIVISGISYTITGSVTNTTLHVTVSAGNQSSANYSAAVTSGSKVLFSPQMESEGYQDFNCAILATLYVPVAGTYTLSATFKDDMLWGIGNSGTGTATWAGPTGGQTLSTIGQTETLVNAYPLMPRVAETSGEDGFTGSASVAVTFSAAGNYPIEIDWDYWYHLGRQLEILCNGVNIPPIPATAITDAQYRYTYRSSATGATSNPSPESPEAALSVLSNNVTATPSLDPQVDKIDFYRLDSGLLNFTYVGTIGNELVNTITGTAVTGTGIQSVFIEVPSGITTGEILQIDTGANQENVQVLEVVYIRLGPTVSAEVTAVFAKTHLAHVPVVGASTIPLNDTLLDTDVAANPILEFDNFEPFPSIDLPKSGFVNVSNGVVSWILGDAFNVRWLPGTVIIIGTVAYTLNTRPTSTIALTATNVQIVGGVSSVVVPPNGTALPYEISEPILAAQPLPYLWGPTDNVSFFFAVGDPLRPGTLYWSKGNNPDSAPDTNQQDVTSPSEPLQNGVIVNGYGLVMSTERGFLIIPNFFNALATVSGTSGSTWTLQESIQTRGLYIPRAICVDGGGNVFFRAKDGIYISPGGQGAKSITDDDLFNLFPHEGYVPQPVTRGAFTVYPPDDTQPQAQKMAVANGYVYYDYLATGQFTVLAATTTESVAATGSQTVTVDSVAALIVGDTYTIDTGANAENIVITHINPLRPVNFTAVFTKTHASGVPVLALALSSIPQTLVYDIAAKGWVVDAYQFPVTVHTLEEGANVNGTLTGCSDGRIRPLDNTGGEVAVSVVLTKCENGGDTRAEKRWGDLYIEAGNR